MSIPRSEFKSMSSDEVDVAKCWQSIDALADLVTTPGRIQVEAAMHPTFGPLISETTNKLLTVMIQATDFNKPISPEQQSEIAKLASDTAGHYMSFLSKRFGEMASMMQMLPPESLFVDIRKAEDIEGVNPAEMKELREKANKLMGSSDNNNIIAGKLKPSLNKLMGAGMMAAGGQAEFAKIQMDVLELMPEEAKQHANILLTGQFVGAIIRALTSAAHAKNMGLAAVMGPLEAIMAARRMTGIGYAGIWGQTAEASTAFIGSMFVANVSKCLEVENNESSKQVADDIIKNMMDKASHPGNGTIN